MQLYKVLIPAKPHLAIFAHQRYGHPVWINNQTTLGTLINSLITSHSNYRSKFSEASKDIRLKYLTSQITCAAPHSDMVRGRAFGISLDHTIAINQFLENQFEEALYFYCQRNANWQKRYAGIRESIHAFCNFYQIEIEEHITYDALKQMEYRYRTKKAQKNPRNIVPSPIQ